MSGASPRARILLALGFAATLAVRLAFLHAFPGDYDTESYGIVADLLSHGGDPYRDNATATTTRRSGVSCSSGRGPSRGRQARISKTVVGLLLTAVDAATAWLVYRLARSRSDPERSGVLALLFFANPISVLITSFHGQFDGVSILFLLVALAAAAAGRTARAAASLSASVLVKHLTLFHPLVFSPARGMARRGPRSPAPYGVFLASFVPYGGSWREIGRQVFVHRGLTGYYGIEATAASALRAESWVPDADLRRGRRWSPSSGSARRAPASLSAALSTVILIFLPGFRRQYCVWPLALGALFRGPGIPALHGRGRAS